jgi:membrane associated rhomboid family serine protease/Zn-finger nucleic acid-binding protein
MLPCPSCRDRLNRIQTPKGFIYGCPKCGGRSVTIPVLRKDADGAFVKDLLAAAREKGTHSRRQCPHCGREMTRCSLSVPRGTLELDYCALCNQVWFDPKEYQSVPPPPPDRSQELSPRCREALAMYKLSQVDPTPAIDEEGPEDTWQYVPAVLGLPVEFNDTPVARRPWVTWGLSAAMAALFVLLLATHSVAAAAKQMGFIPDQWHRDGGLTILTSFFLHAGVWHLVSNLYFFMIFADNVEDHLGIARFVLLLLGCHLAGLLVHALGDPRAGIPLVGASGGISGVLAYYAMTFPQAKVGFMVAYWTAFGWVRIPVTWALVAFVGLQLLGVWQQSMGLSGVSSFGHLGGLIVGLIAGLWGRLAAPRGQEPSSA